MLEEILLGDEAVAVRDEVAQDVEYLRAQVDTPSSTAQFTAARIERIIPEKISHGA
jgi:hypothetical protein